MTLLIQVNRLLVLQTGTACTAGCLLVRVFEMNDSADLLSMLAFVASYMQFRGTISRFAHFWPVPRTGQHLIVLLDDTAVHSYYAELWLLCAAVLRNTLGHGQSLVTFQPGRQGSSLWLSRWLVMIPLDGKR